MRHVLFAGVLLVSVSPALAQRFTPISGPNDPVPSPICDLVNFGFCPQPPSTPPLLPDPNETARVAAPLPPAAAVPPHRRHRRTMRPTID